ncbi:hypothetical protein DL93DRAFT_2228770 [Clavulina sp. PMI_390]|nr:hypothetical protein DL93DRAFT_2228770 [Clavulina sp. PMI_390]
MTTINRLPVELFSSIFLKVCDGLFDPELMSSKGDADSNLLTAAINLSSVTSFWRQVAVSTPQLWTAIVIPFGYRDFDTLSSMVKIRLERAGGAPLDLAIKIALSPPLNDFQHIWGLVVPHLSHCQHLTLTNIDSSFVPHLLPLPGTLNDLQWLNVQANLTETLGQTPVPTLFRLGQESGAPSLARLEIRGINCPPEAFSKLSNLAMDFERVTYPRQSIVRQYLEGSPLLDTLIMLARSILQDVEGDILDPIPLPLLRRVAFGHWEWPDSIAAPAAQHVVLFENTVPRIASLTPTDFPTVEHISICSLMRSSNETVPLLPIFPCVRRIDIVRCGAAYPILQLLMNTSSEQDEFPALEELVICRSGRFDRAGREVVPTLKALLGARPQLKVLCDTDSLEWSPQWHGWTELAPELSGKIKQLIGSPLPAWASLAIYDEA